MSRFLRVAACALLLWGPAARAQYVDPSLRWRTLDTEHFSVHFAEKNRAQAQLAAEVAESVYPRVTGWLRWEPESRTHFVVLDSADFSNGLSTPLPFSYFEIFLSPPDEGELLQNREWLELVITHEFTHIVHLDKARGGPLFMRRIFGRIPLGPIPVLIPGAFPDLLEPRWVLEGLAVYSESDWTKGYGRLGQSQFEGEMRAETARGFRPLRELNAEGRGFPLNRDYLYGSYFFMFLAERYGPQAVPDYVEVYSGLWFPFRVEGALSAVTGKSMSELWSEYYDWLNARFAAKTVEPARKPDEGGEVLERAWSLTSPLVTPQGDRWFVRGDGYTLPRLMRRTPLGDAEFVRQVEPGTRLAASPRGELLLAQLEICGNYNYYYDLYRLSPGGGLERLTRCGRFRFAAPLADGRIAAVRVAGGVGEVVVLNGEGGFERLLYRAAQGEALTGLAARGDAVVVTSLRGRLWSLSKIESGRVQVLVVDSAVKHSPRFGDSGDEIYFVANYGNVYNVWSWRPGERRLARWTEARNGVREISAPVRGEMLVTTIEADGDLLRLHQLPDAPLEYRDATASPVAEPPPAARGETVYLERPYAPWSSLLPRSWLPAGYLADGALALGAQTFGQDALGLHFYTLAPLYEFTQHQLLGSASYVYDQRHGLLFNRSMTVKASAVNDQKLTGRDIQAYEIDETGQWVSLWRSLSLATRYYGGLGGALDRETLHDLAAGSRVDRDKRVLGLVAGVDRRREQFLSEGPSEGQQLRLFAETSNGLHGAFSGNFYRGDLRVHLPAGSSVFSLRWNEAYSQPAAEAIQLGGTFSEEVAGFDLPVLDQREFPLRGYRSGEAVLTGHHARLGTLEWRVPLRDVDRHFMSPPVGLNRLSMSVFLDTGTAWDDGLAHRYYRSGGLELVSEPRLGYLLGLQLRAGVAKGFEAPGETVAYLKVGRSF
ncbi:MAG TPA: hypothetical protein VFI80_12720 [Burkholderiales bacterium]|nr:hypothetical protein [Burkholderiales bacterium]